MIDTFGRLEIPLYHGTSSIFKDSIIRNGLGAVNPANTYNVKGLIERLVKTFDNEFNLSEWWQCNHFIFESMLDNRVASSNLNFRYGSLYLTPSCETAIRYAKSNLYGSELISSFFEGFGELERLSKKSSEKVVEKSNPIRKLMKINPRPILITIRDINISVLRSEKGGPADEQLEIMKAMDPILWQQLNFETDETIQSSYFEIECISVG